MVSLRLAAAAAAFFVSAISFAAVPVNSVLSFTQGAGVTGYAAPASALGFPDPLTGESIGFPNILSPFSPPFEENELVGIGAGGEITLAFDQPIAIVPGAEIGVFTNVGLQDASYPNGVATASAATFTPPRTADVSVSLNGVDFFTVGRTTFSNPSNYFAEASNPYLTSDVAAGGMADFGATFGFDLEEFAGRDWGSIKALLHGTAGGTWIDADAALPGLGSPRFQFVRFSIPTGGIAGTPNTFYVDAVFAADNALVPEPAIGLLFLSSFLLMRRRA